MTWLITKLVLSGIFVLIGIGAGWEFKKTYNEISELKKKLSNPITIIVSSFSPDIPSQYNHPMDLTWDGDHLWTSVGPKSSEGPAVGRLYKISPEDGSIISWLEFPGLTLEGITWDGSYLWGVASNTLYKLNRDGSIVNSFRGPDTSGNPHGLCYDGHFLWLAYSSPDTIYKIDPQSEKIVSSFQAPNVPWGLAWDGKYLWNSDPKLNLIYCIDPENGDVVSKYAGPGSYPAGLTWDGSYLWTVDYKAKKIYILDIRKSIAILERPLRP